MKAVSTKEIVIPDTYIPLGELEINGMKLRKFQEDLYYALQTEKEVCITAPTGSGKTFSLLILLLYSLNTRLPVVGIYPSKALINDQYQSLEETLLKLNFTKTDKNFFKGKITLSKNGKILLEEKIDELYIIRLTHETKQDVKGIIDEYFPTGNRHLIILTVPEYPYIFLTNLGLTEAFSKAAEIVSKKTEISKDDVKEFKLPEAVIKHNFTTFAKALNGYFFIDEFHLYSGFARSSLNILLDMIRDYNRNENYKFVFSSATPLGIRCNKIISADVSDSGSKIRKRTKVIFHFSSNPQEEVVDFLSKNDLNSLLESDKDKKVGIILDRIFYIARLCEKIPEASVIWGLKNYGKCKVSQDPRSERIIIGNNAISFGLDIPNLDIGFIHAHDAESAIQRIGRFGRRGNGEAEVRLFISSDFKVTQIINNLQSEEIKYSDFIQLIRSIYQQRLDDGLDRIEFSKEREEITFYTYKLLKMVATGEIDIEPLRHNKLPQVINLKPSAEDYFHVFAFRPGGITGVWCDGSGSDDFFSMARNFEYNNERGCFEKNPLKQLPEVVVQDKIAEKFLPFEKFVRKYNPRIVLNNRNYLVHLKNMRELQSTYVLVITPEDEKGASNSAYPAKFTELARVIASYESAFPMCVESKFYLTKNLRCSSYDGLLVFI